MLSEQINGLVLDTETTGLSVEKGARLVEIGWAVVKAGKLAFSGSSFVHPGIPIPPELTAIHGISDEMVAGAGNYRQVADVVYPLIHGELLIFHNAPFDLPFIHSLLAAAAIPPLSNTVLCTLGLSRGRWGSGYGAKNKLVDVAARLEIPKETAHRAEGDCRMTAQAVGPLADWYEAEQGITSVEDLAALSVEWMRKTAFTRRVPA